MKTLCFAQALLLLVIDTVRAEDEWSFLVMADFHGSNNWSFAPLTNNPNAAKDDKVKTIRAIGEKYGGELIVLPGDSNSYGSTDTQMFIDRLGGTANEAVYEGGYNCYTSVRKMFSMGGYDTVLACVGDHEIGGNKGFSKYSDKDSKLTTISSLRQAFADGYNRDENNVHRFRDSIGKAPSRPFETEYFGTSFAYVHKNTLFVTVDAFQMIGNGSLNYMDRQNGRGGEGAITCTVTGPHLTWFEEVLSEAKKIPAIKHTVVQAHLPIIQPVRKVKCSGQFMDDARDSMFWKIMNKYDVDIYLAGEVHSNTVAVSKDGSDLVQVVSRARAFNNFLKVDVTDDVIQLISYNEYGNKPKWNAQYEEHGRLTIDKSSFTKEIKGSGVLAPLDQEAVLIHYDFKEETPLASRQVPGLSDDTNLIADRIEIRGAMCYKSMENHGAFGVQYDAQLRLAAIVPNARKDGSNAGSFDGNSRFAIFGVGPYGSGQPVSLSIWFKTSVGDKDMILVHYGTTYGNSIKAWNRGKDHFTLVLEKGVPTIYTQVGSKAKSSLKRNLGDNQWHRVDVSMPRASCRVSQMELYVDGQLQPTQVEGPNSSFFALTSGNLSIGGFGYSSLNHELAYPNLNPFVGMIDDFKLYGRPLKADGDLYTIVREQTCDKSNGVRFNKKRVPGNCAKKCMRKKTCIAFEKKNTGSKHCILFNDRPGFGKKETGVSCARKILN